MSTVRYSDLSERQRNLIPSAVRASMEAAELHHHANHPDHPRQNPEPQSTDREGQLVRTREAEKDGTGRVHIRIVSVRKRLLDPDNLVPKWYIDCLRYCGLIREDTPEAVTLETSQRKCAKGEAERTEITIIYPEEAVTAEA